MKRPVLTAGLVVTALFLAACAPGANLYAHTMSSAGVVAGFWRGLWHGIIAPLMFVVSLFTDQVGIYEAHNSGGWYNFGFLIGISCFHGGRAAQSAARRRWPREPPARRPIG